MAWIEVKSPTARKRTNMVILAVVLPLLAEAVLVGTTTVRGAVCGRFRFFFLGRLLLSVFAFYLAWERSLSQPNR